MLVSTGDDALPSSRLLRILLAFAILVHWLTGSECIDSACMPSWCSTWETPAPASFTGPGTGLMLGGALTQRLSKTSGKPLPPPFLQKAFARCRPANQRHSRSPPSVRPGGNGRRHRQRLHRYPHHARSASQTVWDRRTASSLSATACSERP